MKHVMASRSGGQKPCLHWLQGLIGYPMVRWVSRDSDNYNNALPVGDIGADKTDQLHSTLFAGMTVHNFYLQLLLFKRVLLEQLFYLSPAKDSSHHDRTTLGQAADLISSLACHAFCPEAHGPHILDIPGPGRTPREERWTDGRIPDGGPEATCVGCKGLRALKLGLNQNPK